MNKAEKTLFNIACGAIVVGGIVIAISILRGRRK